MIRLALMLCVLAGGAEAAPRAVCMVGDSLTYGYTFDDTPIALRLSTLISRPVVNMGVGSNRAASIKARYDRYCAPYPYYAAIWEGCTNDLDFDGTTGADCWATTLSWISAVEAAGQRPIILTIFPRWGHVGWTSDEEAERVAYNALAESYAESHPEVTLVQMDSTLGDGGTPPALQTSLDWGDKLHINGNGMQAAAEKIATAF